MTEANTCPKCGGNLPGNAPSGVCPKCLMLAAMVGDESSQPDGSGDVYAITTPQPPGGFNPPAPTAIAAHFPHLEILGVLGHGGMGAVYKARQTKLDRIVALKIIRPESADDPTFAERFNREARTLARLNHPNIVAVHDFGEVQLTDTDQSGKPRRLYYFLMEYVDGMNLRQLMESGEVSPQQALAIIPQICEALQFAHDEGIVHRDIKPENVLIDSKGRVKIADYGLAKLAARSEEDFTLTATHQVMGTPRYMAPEQMTGSHHVDHRADIYSLGVVFYEMLTGEVPMGQFDPPSKRAQIDARLDEIVLRALAREPDRRFQRASEMKSSVEGISSLAVERRAVSEAPPQSRGVSTIMEREAVAAWHWVVGRPAAEANQVPQYPTILALMLAVAGSLALFFPWMQVDVAGQSLEFAGSDFVSGVTASVIFAGIALLLIAIPERLRISFGWNCTTLLLAVSTLICAITFRGEALSTPIRMPIDAADRVDESSTSWNIRRLSMFELAMAHPGPLLAFWQEPAPAAASASESSSYDDYYGPRISQLDHRITFLSGFYGSLGASIVLLILSATGIRHSIADTKDVEDKSRSTGSPVARLRFAAANRKELGPQIVAHFESHGYRLERQTSGQWVFVRGAKFAGAYSTDIREYHTTLTVLTSFAREGWMWIHCVWSVRTMGAWIGKKDIATLEAEGDELKSMLADEAAASPPPLGAPSGTQLHDSSVPAVDTPTQLTTPPPSLGAPFSTSQPGTFDSTTGKPIDFDEVYAEVEGPALAMLVVGMLMVIGNAIAVGICLSSRTEDELAWIGIPGIVVGLGMFIGGLNMRMLWSRGWSQLGMIAGFIPNFGLMLSVPISGWSMAVLNRPHVQQAFQQRRRQRRTASTVSDPSQRDQVDLVEIESDLSGPTIGMLVVGFLMMIGHTIAIIACMDHPMGDEIAWLWVPGIIVGLGMIVGGLNMRGLRSRGWAQLGVIAGFLPVSPGSLITIPISIWAMKELNRDEVRRAFIQHRRERTQGRRDSSLALRDAPPRFSRRAVVGALWAGLFVLAAAATVIPVKVVRTQVVNEHGETSMVTPGHDYPVVWVMVLALPILLAPVGTTILGCMAINDIRHSNGRITGRGLAVADALGFPLLLLNGAIFGAFFYFFSEATHMNFAMSMFLALGTTAAVGSGVSNSIVQSVWKNATQSAEPTSVTERSVASPHPELLESPAPDPQRSKSFSMSSMLLFLGLWSAMALFIGLITYQWHREMLGQSYRLEDRSAGFLETAEIGFEISEAAPAPEVLDTSFQVTARGSGSYLQQPSTGEVPRSELIFEHREHGPLRISLPELGYVYEDSDGYERTAESGLDEEVFLDWLRMSGTDPDSPGVRPYLDAMLAMARGAFNNRMETLVDRDLFVRQTESNDFEFTVSHNEEWEHLTWCLAVWLIGMVALLAVIWLWKRLQRGYVAAIWMLTWVMLPSVLGFGPWLYWRGFDEIPLILQGSPQGSSPLKSAVLSGDEQAVAGLLTRGADPNDETDSLFWAAGIGNREIVRQLLLAKADVDEPNLHGITPLMFAAAIGNVECVEMLLNAGADIDKQDTGYGTDGYYILSNTSREINLGWPGERQTPLMLAVREGHVDVVEILLERGADLDITDADGQYAADYLRESYDPEIDRIWQRFGHDPSTEHSE